MQIFKKSYLLLGVSIFFLNNPTFGSEKNNENELPSTPEQKLTITCPELPVSVVRLLENTKAISLKTLQEAGFPVDVILEKVRPIIARGDKTKDSLVAALIKAEDLKVERVKETLSSMPGTTPPHVIALTPFTPYCTWKLKSASQNAEEVLFFMGIYNLSKG